MTHIGHSNVKLVAKLSPILNKSEKSNSLAIVKKDLIESPTKNPKEDFNVTVSQTENQKSFFTNHVPEITINKKHNISNVGSYLKNRDCCDEDMQNKNIETPLQMNKKTHKKLKCTEKTVLNKTDILSKPIETENMVKNLNNFIDNKENEKNLHDELFDNFQLAQTSNECNPNTMSPTAAFLMTFPVVSTIPSSKPTETETSFIEGSNLLRMEEKSIQPKDHSLFESISSILNDLNAVPENKQVDSLINCQYYVNKTKSCPNENSKTDVIYETHKSSKSKLNVTSNQAEPKNKKYLEKDSSSKLDKTKENLPKVIDNMEKKSVSSVEYTNSSSAVLRENKSLSSTTKSSNSATTNSDLSQHNNNQSDFYVSLSTLGLLNKSTFDSTTLTPPVSSHFNFQISSLTQPRNIIDSRSLIAEPPFTFSLTKCTDSTTTTNSATISNLSHFDEHNQILNRIGKSSEKSMSTNYLVPDRFVVPTEPSISTLNRCNSFNPFAFDGVPVSSTLGLSNLAATSTSTSFTFTLTPTFSSIPVNTPLLSNYDPIFSSSFDIPPPLTNNSIKVSKKERTPSIQSVERDQMNCAKSTKLTSSNSMTKSNKNHVNWMTSTSKTADTFIDFASAPYCSTLDENQPWSPNRTVENSNLLSTPVLPTLQGDLALNTISSCPINSKLDVENKKSVIKPNIYNQNSSNNHKNITKTSSKGRHEQNVHLKSSKSEKNLFSSNAYQSKPLPPVPPPLPTSKVNENTSTNNFHTISQLLDQERQTTKENSCFNFNEQKFTSKEYSSHPKSKIYTKCDSEGTNNQSNVDKFHISNYNQNSNALPNDCDRDLSAYNSYFFAQSKRLKLNYSSGDYFGANQSTNNYDSSSVSNDIYTPYSTYQGNNENDYNTIPSSCMNSLPNQSYSHQYSSSQPYQQHQPFYASHGINQNSCDTVDPLLTIPLSGRAHNTSNYSQNISTSTLTSTPRTQNYETFRGNPIKQQNTTFLHQQSKTNETSTPGKAPLFDTDTSPSQSSIKYSNRGSTLCSSKITHSNTFNTLPLNQTWNESFSWMSNPIEKPCNTNLYPIDSFNKSMNISNGNGNNTIPNFNLTTIFPDCNKT